MSPSELQLYSPYAEGLRYLLAQSPDTRDLVPEENEGNWEPIGKKKDVKVTILSWIRRSMVAASLTCFVLPSQLASSI